MTLSSESFFFCIFFFLMVLRQIIPMTAKTRQLLKRACHACSGEGRRSTTGIASTTPMRAPNTTARCVGSRLTGVNGAASSPHGCKINASVLPVAGWAGRSTETAFTHADPLRTISHVHFRKHALNRRNGARVCVLCIGGVNSVIFSV